MGYLSSLSITFDEPVNYFVDVLSYHYLLHTDQYTHEQALRILNGDTSKLIEPINTLVDKLLQSSPDPHVILFFDNGSCIQNKVVYPMYKANRQKSQLQTTVQRYTFCMLKEHFANANNVTVLDTSDFESDIVPYMCHVEDWFDCKHVLNIIISRDKDFLQMLEYNNWLQHTGSALYDKDTALAYVNKRYKKGLSAGYLPVLLAIAGDNSDNIPGVPRYGVTRAYKYIVEYGLPQKLTYGSIKGPLSVHEPIIIRNYRLISFEEQYKRCKKMKGGIL